MKTPIRTMNDYQDMLYMAYPPPIRRTPMNMVSRAAQFSPFAALNGYEELINETARLTDQRFELDDSQTERLNEHLNYLQQHINEHPLISVTFFKPDILKDGGSYETVSGQLRKIDPIGQSALIGTNVVIPMSDICSIAFSLPEENME